MSHAELPFLLGSQYFRAPTPESECWADDLAKMKDLGFNQVKYWAQWRWSHRAPDRFYWDDLDRLMDLAGKNSLGVTINIIMDVSPLWLFERYPDARQIDVQGTVIDPFAVQHRQIGGQPGPCYNHPGALQERKTFLAAAVEHFRAHPAICMWDVWNEPEQSYLRRGPDIDRLTCFCPNCRTRFVQWLRDKYKTLDRLNDVWCRCYERWDQVELPILGTTITDFIDWREFHLDTMTAEARWRLDLARQLDPKSVVYLHVVPNTMSLFQAVTCVDDFELAEHCDVFAATMNQAPSFTTQVTSAARGKVSYNVESHVNFGDLRHHQRPVTLDDLLRDWLPQIGLGVKGFMFWQFRPETTGTEAPCWGVVRLDGSDQPVTHAVRKFCKTISPHAQALMKCPAPSGEIGIFKSRKNELYHFCMDHKLDILANGIEAYLQSLYWMSYPARYVSGQMLQRGDLSGLKLLILPSPIYLSQDEVEALDRWVQAGGVAFCEAHLGSYDATRGRHTRQMPGMGLVRSWGIREIDSTAPRHLKPEQARAISTFLSAEELKAMKDSGGIGGEFVPIRLTGGNLAWGASRYAVLDSPDAQSLGSFDAAHPAILFKRVGRGAVIYCASNLGEGARRDPAGLREILHLAAERAGVKPVCDARADSVDIHVDVLEENGQPRFVMIWNRSDAEQNLRLQIKGRWRGLFTGLQRQCDGSSPIAVPARLVELFVRESD